MPEVVVDSSVLIKLAAGEQFLFFRQCRLASQALRFRIQGPQEDLRFAQRSLGHVFMGICCLLRRGYGRPSRRKNDPDKMASAVRMRRETTLSI